MKPVSELLVPRRARIATAQGLIALVLWVSTVAVGRDLLEDLGPLLGSSLTFLLSGSLLVVAATIRSQGLGWRHRVSIKHLWLCGPFFIAYLGLFYCALGVAASREEAVLVGLANYLWPTWIVLLAIPLQKARPRLLPFVVGVALGLAGVLLAASVSTSEAEGRWPAVAATLAQGWMPLMLAGAGAVAWGIYSNLAKRVPQRETSAAVGLLLVAAGAMLVVPGIVWGDSATWTSRTVIELIYMAIFPTAIAYTLWDRAMRDGNIAVLGLISNLVPIASVALAGALLGIPLRGRLLAGAAAVVIGSLACRRSLSTWTGRRQTEDARPPGAARRR